MSGKRCFKCWLMKPLSEFYKHAQMADGYLNKCKECAKKDVTKHRRENESVREYDRWRYQNNPDRRAATVANARQWWQDHPEARKAHNALNNAVRDGKIIKQPCEICGDTYRIHGHHEDYNKPLEVKWRCAKHHIGYHYGLNE